MKKTIVHGEHEREFVKHKWSVSKARRQEAMSAMRRRRRRRSHDNDSGHGNYLTATPTSPVTFKTTASFLVTKMQLRSTFSIHFKVTTR